MGKTGTSNERSNATDPTGAKGKDGADQAKAKRDAVWVREDGAICFGEECATIAPTDTGRLGLTIRPDKCGQATGAILLDYLIRTAGKGVVIEIPSQIEGLPEK